MLTFSVNSDMNEVVRMGVMTKVKPKTDLGREWLSEAWIKALDGRVGDTMNIDAYGYQVDMHERMDKNKRESNLLSAEDIKNGHVGVADSVASFIETNIDDIVERSEIKTIVEEFVFYQEKVWIEDGINLKKVLISARNYGSELMVNQLRNLMDTHGIHELIEGVLSKEGVMNRLDEVSMA